MTKTSSIGWWALFGVGLLCAIVGWLWVLQRLVKNEAEVAATRVKEAEERYLSQVTDDFQESLKQHMATALNPAEIAEQGVFSGIWTEAKTADTAFDAEMIASWRKDIRLGTVSAEALGKAIQSGGLEFGWIEDGRDLVAGLLLSLVNRGETTEQIVDLLRDRVWNYEGAPLSPAFRLTLIRALIALEPDETLQRLQDFESIRVVEGKLGELKTPYEVLTRRIVDRDIRFYWTKDQLEKLLNKGSKEPLVLLGKTDDSRPGVTVPGLSRWPVVSSRDWEIEMKAVDLSEGGLIWIGGLTGLAVLGIAIGAAVFAGREMRTARMRTDLAASVAHELRTPLAGQRLLLESLLERKDQSPEQKEEYIAMAFRENKRLSRLAEEFLTFSRLERGVLQLDIEAVHVDQVVSGAVESLREKWEDPDCELSISLDEDLPEIAGDHQALVTILRNLLENAWKYSESPRRIGVQAARDTGDVLISVSDGGIGLSAKDQQRIFRQFYRVDRRLARSQEGLGLGLSIVKQLLESMNGHIEVTSEEGNGSTFSIRIPIVA